jgi:hypothetical protein
MDYVDALAAAQARIDELMLEYCPEEMTDEQLATYAKHQVPAISKDTYPRWYDVVLVPEEERDSCRGCVYLHAPAELCPRNGDNKLICAHYTEGPAGIYKER